MRKLEIGGGPSPKEGYEQLDVVKHPGVKYVGPAWKVPVGDNTFDEIYGRHVFEHFTPLEAARVLNEFKRILKPGGTLHLIMPNLEFHARQLLMAGNSEVLPHMSNFEHALYSIYGHQTYHPDNPAMVHKWGYTSKTLVDLLRSHGYTARMIPCRECDLEVKATV